MFRSTFLVAAIALVPLQPATTPLAPPAPAAAACPNPWVLDPLVVYSITQGTLVVFVDESLVVEATGTARLSRSTQDGVGSKSVSIHVGAAAARQLLHDLSQARAAIACDGPAAPIPTPMKSLTVLREGTDTRAHNVSWLVPLPEHQALEQILDAFVTTHFPGF